MKPADYTTETAIADLIEYEQAATVALSELKTHIEQSTHRQTPATGWAPVTEVLNDLNVDHWINEGGMGVDDFQSFLRRYLDFSVKFRHPHYIAHQVSVPDYPAGLATLVNGLTNNPMGIYEMGSGAAALEYAVINWMLRKIGWPPQRLGGSKDQSVTAAGVFTHGGSLANLTAMLAARARIAPEAWVEGNPSDLAVLVPASSHYSNARGLSIMGLGSNSLYKLEVDANGVIIPERMAATLQRLKDDGKRCMALIANVCSTATGLHDPLIPISDFCEEHNIWLHADACHGATALLNDETKKLLTGIERADSVVWDTHKMMQVPVLSAALLLKDGRNFDRAFDQDASYLAYGKSVDDYDTITRTVECTRTAMGFKVFLNLAWRGEAALGEYVRDRYAKTRQFYELIKARDGFTCPYEPETNILCFRFGNEDAGSDELQERIRDHLMRAGKFHITSAVLNGKRHLRITVMNRLTDIETINDLLDAIEATAKELA